MKLADIFSGKKSLILLIVAWILPNSGCAITSNNGSQNSSKTPIVIAHRAGSADAPENTIEAINTAVKNKADMIWLTVQLSKDNIPVLYRPADLPSLTSVEGKISDKNMNELEKINAGYTFKRKNSAGEEIFPYRNTPSTMIPSLQKALEAVPEHMGIILDLKSLPAQPLVAAVSELIESQKAWSRIRFYSTDQTIYSALEKLPQAQRFESRELSRQRLLNVDLAHACSVAPENTWIGFELFREVTVSEKYTLGEGKTTTRAQMWDPESIECVRKAAKAMIVMFAINDEKDYDLAVRLGADAILVDSPALMNQLRTSRKTS